MANKTHFHSLLERDIKTAMADRSESVLRGFCVDYVAYKYQVGYLDGLNDALKIAEAIADQREE
jgi:hypothetical protein